MAPLTFLHAADLHLDSPLLRLDLGDDGAAAAAVRRASRDALVRLVDRALDTGVAFVVLAGDLWDGDWQDVGTGLWFVRQVARLAAAGIPVVFLRGNHDAASEVTASLRWPDLVHELPTAAPATVRLDACRVALHGQGFAAREQTANLAAAYPPPVAGWLNVGVLHTALEGAPGHATYAPCTVADLARRGYDYWALGHVHRFAVHAESPWIVHSGCLQGRHVNETGAKGAVEVAFEADRILEVRHVPLDVVRWERPAVDLAGVEDPDAALDRALAAVRRVASDVDRGIELLVVRPTLAGLGPWGGALLADRRGFADRLSALVATLTPATVVEGIAWTLAEDAGASTLADLGDDAVGDLVRRIDATARSEAMAGEVQALVQRIRARIPDEVRAQLAAGPLAPLLEGDAQGFLEARRQAARAVLGTLDDAS